MADEALCLTTHSGKRRIHKKNPPQKGKGLYCYSKKFTIFCEGLDEEEQLC